MAQFEESSTLYSLSNSDKCPKVTENVWNICKFKGLKETIVDSEILGTEKKGLY